MRVRSFSHVGLTVSSFNRFVQFYSDVFGCRLVGVADHPAERVRTFFGIPGGTRVKVGWVRVPGGGILEIFEFDPQQPAERIPWNRVGLTHFSFNVRNTHRWHDYLAAKGVEIVTTPERSPRGQWFFFVRDFDGGRRRLMADAPKHRIVHLGPVVL